MLMMYTCASYTLAVRPALIIAVGGDEEEDLPGCLANTTKIGGTIRLIVTRYLSIAAQKLSGLNPAMTTEGVPRDSGRWRSLTPP
jgi:hypothetical protein